MPHKTSPPPAAAMPTPKKPQQSHMVDLAANIQARTTKIHEALKAANVPEPSFSADADPVLRIPQSSATTYYELLESIDELRCLLLGPAPLNMTNMASMATYPGLFRILYRFGVFQAIGLHERVSYAEVGRRCGLPESDVRHFLRTAVTLRIFEEPEPEVVAHNSNSAAFIKMPELRDWVGYCTEDIAPATLRGADALAKWPNSQEPHETGMALAFGGKSYQDLLASEPERAARFTAGQSIFARHPARSSQHLVDSLRKAWSGLNCPDTVVEVGGANGAVMKDLLEAFPGIRRGVIQDKPATAMIGAEGDLPESVKGRLEYQSHDYFTMQRVRANAYIFRTLFHAWPDKYVIDILQNHVPALQPGSRVIVNETLLDKPEAGNFIAERQARSQDLASKLCFNGRERSEKEWEDIFASVSPCLKVESYTKPPNSSLATIVAVWDA